MSITLAGRKRGSGARGGLSAIYRVIASKLAMPARAVPTPTNATSAKEDQIRDFCSAASCSTRTPNWSKLTPEPSPVPCAAAYARLLALAAEKTQTRRANGKAIDKIYNATTNGTMHRTIPAVC